ncbi:MAG: response regulator transcription factor, partial [Paracoccaceae bacterium]|nr:response regulator transcription factor [Paracoccaceae bacterium]
MMNRPRAAPAAAPLEDLTRREEEILRLVAKGLSNKEVARELDLQEKTVKHYMTAILGKLQAKNRVEAAIIAHEAWREKR